MTYLALTVTAYWLLSGSVGLLGIMFGLWAAGVASQARLRKIREETDRQHQRKTPFWCSKEKRHLTGWLRAAVLDT